MGKERQLASGVCLLAGDSLGSFCSGFSWLALPSGISFHFPSPEALWALVQLCQKVPSNLGSDWAGDPRRHVPWLTTMTLFFVPPRAAVAALAASVISHPPHCCAAVLQHDAHFSLNLFLGSSQSGNVTTRCQVGCVDGTISRLQCQRTEVLHSTFME